jgi:hypothetical protein
MSDTRQIYNLSQTGIFVDGYSELIQGMGERAVSVQNYFVQIAQSRDMPEINVVEVQAKTKQEMRTYHLLKTQPGATTTVYIGRHGEDLYVSWRTYVRRIPNRTVILITLLVSAFASFSCVAIPVYSTLRGIILGLRNSLNPFGPQASMSFGDVIGSFMFASFMTLSAFILLLLVTVAVLGWLGRFVSQDMLRFLTVHLSIFDAEDITAMSLSAHNILFSALEQANIDTSALRVKQNFKGGQASEVI